MLSLSPWSIKLLRFENWNFPRVKKIAKCKHHLLHVLEKCVLGKLHWFLYLLLSYYYDPGMFIFCRSLNFVEKVVLNENMAAKMASRVSYLVYYNCI